LDQEFGAIREGSLVNTIVCGQESGNDALFAPEYDLERIGTITAEIS